MRWVWPTTKPCAPYFITYNPIRILQHSTTVLGFDCAGSFYCIANMGWLGNRQFRLAMPSCSIYIFSRGTAECVVIKILEDLAIVSACSRHGERSSDLRSARRYIRQTVNTDRRFCRKPATSAERHLLIVGDVPMKRAQGIAIISTPRWRGYQLSPNRSAAPGTALYAESLRRPVPCCGWQRFDGSRARRSIVARVCGGIDPQRRFVGHQQTTVCCLAWRPRTRSDRCVSAVSPSRRSHGYFLPSSISRMHDSSF